MTFILFHILEFSNQPFYGKVSEKKIAEGEELLMKHTKIIAYTVGSNIQFDLGSYALELNKEINKENPVALAAQEAEIMQISFQE